MPVSSMPKNPISQTIKPRTKRRARGTGSVFFSPTLQQWVGRVTIGIKPDGSPHRIERRAATQKELFDKLESVRPPAPTTTLAQWCERWFVGLPVRPSTFDRYKDTVTRFLAPTLGHVPLVELSAGQIDFAARQWTAAGLGPGSIRTAYGVLRTILEAARRMRLIETNPVRDSRMPRPPRSRIEPFTPEELLRIIDEAGRWPDSRLFALLASVGCRLGEALALDVADYQGGAVHIHRTYSRVHGMRATKSENGNRTVRVPIQALAAVQPRTGKGPLFPGRFGERRWHSSVWHSWRLLLKRLGLKYRNAHQLRHSYCSIALANGVPVADLAKAVGDSPQTIMRTYAHASGVDTADAMERALRVTKARRA